MAFIAEVARELRHLHHTIEGFETLAAGILVMETAATVLHAAGQTMVTEIRSKIGEPQPSWPPLSPVTIEDKARKGYPVPAPSGRVEKGENARTESNSSGCSNIIFRRLSQIQA